MNPPSNERRARMAGRGSVFRYNIVISVVSAALSVYVMLVSAAMPRDERGGVGPGYWPYFLGTVLLLFSVGLLIETFVRRHFERRRAESSGAAPEPRTPPINFASPGLKCIYKLCGLLILFVLMLRYGNFLFATFVFVPACMWLLGMRNKVILASVTAGLPLSIYFIFTYLLKITLP